MVLLLSPSQTKYVRKLLHKYDKLVSRMVDDNVHTIVDNFMTASKQVIYSYESLYPLTRPCLASYPLKYSFLIV